MQWHCRSALAFHNVLTAALLVCFCCTYLKAQSNSLDPTALVRRAVQHRLDSFMHHRPIRYDLRRIDERRDSTKVIVETADGNVARLIELGGKPLTVEANKADLDRLDNLAQHPELQQRRQRNEQRDQERVIHLLNLLPDGFLYKLEGVAACPSGTCYHLSFKPNPRFNPPDLESDIFRGVAGELLIDKASEQMTLLNGRFVADVAFGFGILGRINRGSTFSLEQANVGGDDWELTRLKLSVTGKALMLKSLSFHVTEEASHFAPVPAAMHYRDAIELLKKADAASTTYTP
jgi:hypothetical protein